VTEVQPLSGAQGTCYSIDSIAASIKAPVDIGIYCYAADGVLTAARVGFGVLKLVSQVAGRFMGHLADQGERVRDGQPLAWVRLAG
jgi:biotin carboxyl carrier protein